MKEFEGKVAIITGASIGIGLATAELFYEKGCKLALVDINGEGLEKLKEKMPDALMCVCDVSDTAAVKDVVEKTKEHFGRVDILVNNAGFWRHSAPFAETDSELWTKIIGTNLIGTMNFTRYALPYMLENKYGRIINVASVAGVYGNRNMATYSASKGGMIAFTKAIAKETAEFGITVNSISPGMVSNTQNTVDATDMNYMKRTSKHSEHAELIAFLASDKAAYISGQDILIDGCRRMI